MLTYLLCLTLRPDLDNARAFLARVDRASFSLLSPFDRQAALAALCRAPLVAGDMPAIERLRA